MGYLDDYTNLGGDINDPQIEKLKILDEAELAKGSPLDDMEMSTILSYGMPQEGKSFARDVGMPMAGAILGGSVGAGIGRATESLYGKYVKGEDTPLLFEGAEFKAPPEDLFTGSLAEVNMKQQQYISDNNLEMAKNFKKSVIGQSVIETLGVYVGEKIFSAAWSGTKHLVKSVPKKFGGEFLNKIINSVPKSRKKAFTNKLALKFKEHKIPESVTKRVITRGPKKVLKPEYFKEEGVRLSTLKKVHKINNQIFNSVNREYDKVIKPILTSSKKEVDTSTLSKIFKEGTDDILDVNTRGKFIANERSNAKVAAYFNRFKKTFKNIIKTKPTSTQKIGNIVDRFGRPLTKDITPKPTPLQIHNFKQSVNKILKDNPRIFENTSAKNLMITLKTEASKSLDDIVPGYAKTSNKYRDIFKIQEEMGIEFSPDKVNKIMKGYFDPSKKAFKESINKYIAKNKGLEISFNNALDEFAASNYFRDISGAGPNIRSSAGPFGFSFPLLKKTPKKIGDKLLRREAKNTLRPLTERVIHNAASYGTGQLRRFGPEQ